MPRGAYFKGSGDRVWRDLVRRYGRKGAERRFYGLANKLGLIPGNPKNKH